MPWLTRPAPHFHTVELRFQFRYAAPQPPRLLDLDPDTLWFSPAGQPPATASARRKVEAADIAQALADLGGEARYNQLCEHIMTLTDDYRGLQARLDRRRRWPLPLAPVARLSARGRARVDAQGRCDEGGSEEIGL